VFVYNYFHMVTEGFSRTLWCCQ